MISFIKRLFTGFPTNKVEVLSDGRAIVYIRKDGHWKAMATDEFYVWNLPELIQKYCIHPDEESAVQHLADFLNTDSVESQIQRHLK